MKKKKHEIDLKFLQAMFSERIFTYFAPEWGLESEDFYLTYEYPFYLYIQRFKEEPIIRFFIQFKPKKEQNIIIRRIKKIKKLQPSSA